MTEKTFDRDASGNLTKRSGWFSWRHQTSEAHKAAVARYQSLHGPAARRARAAARLEATR